MANPGVEFVSKTPIKRKIITKYFLRGWWTDNNDVPITEALFGDTVKFHLQTQQIPVGENVTLKLFDDDTILNTTEDQTDDEITLVYSSNGQPAISDQVDGNKKIIKTIILDNFESILKSESDGILELFFKCTYGTDVDIVFPEIPQNCLKVKGMPKIIFVNGQWKLANRLPFGIGENFGPISGGKPYWYDGNAMVERARTYFQFNSLFASSAAVLSTSNLESKKFILYYDGSTNWGFDQSGGERYINGSAFAQENYAEIIKGIGGNEIAFVSHSEGGAFAAGMAEYLHSKGFKIKEHLLLSPDEGEEFSINSAIPSYQLTYMFFSSSWNPAAAYINYEKLKMMNRRFRKWGSYYAIVDWVTNEHKVSGITKMGIVRKDNLGWGTVHGSTNDTSVFDKVEDLKNVSIRDVQGMANDKFYAARGQTPTVHQTLFYRVDDEYVTENCPPISEIN